MPHGQRHFVSAWRFDDVWVERYRHAPGPTAPVDRHAHAEYQIGLSLDAAGEYHCRGGRHPIAPGALRLIQPGEMHASRDFGAERALTTHLLYVPPSVLGGLIAEIAGTPVAPVFPTPVVTDPALAAVFGHLCRIAESRLVSVATNLEWESRLFATLAAVVERHAETRVVANRPGTETGAIATARAYLHDHLTENVSLTELATLVGLTPHYLDRAFARAVGVPPHRYQIQLRVARAKTLLGGGLPIDAVSRMTGFSDQSHLGRHFKRLVGVSPGRYRLERAPSPVEEAE